MRAYGISYLELARRATRNTTRSVHQLSKQQFPPRAGENGSRENVTFERSDVQKVLVAIRVAERRSCPNQPADSPLSADYN